MRVQRAGLAVAAALDLELQRVALYAVRAAVATFVSASQSALGCLDNKNIGERPVRMEGPELGRLQIPILYSLHFRVLPSAYDRVGASATQGARDDRQPQKSHRNGKSTWGSSAASRRNSPIRFRF